MVGAAASRPPRRSGATPLVGVLDKPSEFAGRAVHEWTRAGVPGRRRHHPVRPVPADDPHRAREGAGEAGSTTTSSSGRTPTTRSTRSTRSTWRRPSRARRRAPVLGGRRGGRRDRPDGEGPAHRHRHGLLARRHGHGPLRRAGPAPRRRATAGASPASSTATSSNVPDVMQRVHWDPEFARKSGNPTTFDYGRMRETWLIHLCTDWMGDDAWLWKLDCEFRMFNYVGDTQWMRGTVVEQVPRRRRPARGRPRPAGGEPARRDHHAGPRHDPAAEPRARPGAPARSARRRDEPRAGARPRSQRGVRDAA